MEFFHGEHLRLDWGLGNPNKTATLIACLLVLAHVIRHLLAGKRGNLIVFSGVFLALGICLIHTYSRGGIVAAIAGQFAYWAARSRGKFTWPSRPQWICGVILVVILSAYSAMPQVDAASRYTQGIGPGAAEDLSVTNRLRIWKDVPRMMVDAPGGWGLGNSGYAWMQWYQPLETRYLHRTLVNSHFSWLVEFGWIGRFLYLFGWGMILVIVFARHFPEEKKTERRAAGIATGIWIAFAVGAFFSSVAESWQLWVLPVLALLWMLVRVRPFAFGEIRRSLILIGVLSLLCLAITAVAGSIRKAEIPIGKQGGVTKIGTGRARSLLLHPDEKVVGRHFGMDLRENYREPWLVSDRLPLADDILETVERIILSGDFPDTSEIDNFPGEIVVLNPTKMLKEKSGHPGTRRVILGSLRKDPVARSVRSACKADDFGWSLEQSNGKKLYLGNWTKFFSKTPPLPSKAR